MLCLDDLFEMHTLGLYRLINFFHKDFFKLFKIFSACFAYLVLYLFSAYIYRHNNLNVRTDNGQDPCSHGLN